MKILVDLILVNYELDTPLSKRKIKKVIRLIKDESLHKKWSFPLRISSVPADLATFTEEIINVKLHFLCSELGGKMSLRAKSYSYLTIYKKF